MVKYTQWRLSNSIKIFACRASLLVISFDSRNLDGKMSGQLIVRNFAFDVVHLDEGDYGALLVGPTDAPPFSITLHPYQIMKLLRALRAAGFRDDYVTSIVNDSHFIKQVARDGTEADLLATFTEVVSVGDGLVYRVSPPDRDSITLAFNDQLTRKLAARISDCITRISTLTEH